MKEKGKKKKEKERERNVENKKGGKLFFEKGFL